MNPEYHIHQFNAHTDRYSPALLMRVQRLGAQLTGQDPHTYIEQNPEEIVAKRLSKLYETGSLYFVIYTVRELIVGMATLIHVYKTTGFEGHIEDVVVDKNYQRLGLGADLMQHLISRAHALEMTSVSLTSNPDNPERAAAIELYKKLGFEPANGLMRLKL